MSDNQSELHKETLITFSDQLLEYVSIYSSRITNYSD